MFAQQCLINIIDNMISQLPSCISCIEHEIWYPYYFSTLMFAQCNQILNSILQFVSLQYFHVSPECEEEPELLNTPKSLNPSGLSTASTSHSAEEEHW